MYPQTGMWFLTWQKSWALQVELVKQGLMQKKSMQARSSAQSSSIRHSPCKRESQHRRRSGVRWNSSPVGSRRRRPRRSPWGTHRCIGRRSCGRWPSCHTDSDRRGRASPRSESSSTRGCTGNLGQPVRHFIRSFLAVRR